MTNTAQLFLESTHVFEYAELKKLLEEEFKCDYKCSADIHTELRECRKSKQESFHEYMLQMKKIAAIGDIDTQSVIRYVVDGLQMKSDFKYTLYSCKSFRELQEQYEVRTEKYIQTVPKRRIIASTVDPPIIYERIAKPLQSVSAVTRVDICPEIVQQ
ncbi:uncharacterized protein LOC115628653 [Scaptodrosophila lebanonensis]|uniref:Uncharacterized protein LOC115628653 n=1 Tax=Drosophila lebanonensis TaxID=7225 RepID=A0A6J2TYI3_DROLE|nr:uncharacterized protein LOC115628653 [Scaptodrosophila lebanonensis]